MLNVFYKRIHNKKGFTLVELIVVIAILGILAGIAVPKYTGFQEKAKVSANQANIKMIQNALDVYYAEKDSYPKDDTEMSAFVTSYLNGAAPAVQMAEDVADGSKFVMEMATGTVQIKEAPEEGKDLEVK